MQELKYPWFQYSVCATTTCLLFNNMHVEVIVAVKMNLI